MKTRSIVFSFFLSLFVLCSFPVFSEVKLPVILGDNMVLQQQTQAAIWGKASPHKSVRVTTSWDKKSYTTHSDVNGNWKLKVQTPVAGGPYEISLSDGKELIIKNVLIGEVWVCSGQSNMEMPVKGFNSEPVIGSNEAIATSSGKNIRFITITRETSLEPRDDFKGVWLECEPQNVAEFSATGYFFGEMLYRALNVPIGLICSSWGGTRIEPWISENGLSDFDWVQLPDKNAQSGVNAQTPTVLFNAMINPMLGYGIRGAIWYQGESNREEPDRYEKLMPRLVENWRKEWNIGDFSFYYAQIAPYDYRGGLNSAYLREAQQKSSETIANGGMACLMDVGERYSIHPANKKAVGDRLAYLALAKTYGKKGFAHSGPVFKEMKVEGSVVKLYFDNVPNGLTSYGKELELFKVSGENKNFHQAKAVIWGKEVWLSSPYVSNPVAVRYAFDDFVVGDLFNTEGLPASSFRTDSW
ncbi:MAG: sialate O-acetylesterase [Prolixibacteraceae bacterium]|nr:sialate O-acetylesterase [Prolixibacteraceae bacterium]